MFRLQPCDRGLQVLDLPLLTPGKQPTMRRNAAFRGFALKVGVDAKGAEQTVPCWRFRQRPSSGCRQGNWNCCASRCGLIT